MEKQHESIIKKGFWWLSLIICVILVPILIVNVTMIVKSYVKPDDVPDFLGYKPFIVLSGSMEPAIMQGDVVIVKETDAQNLKSNDIIAFKTDNVVVTHRITEVNNTENGVSYITKGDNNNGIDAKDVLPENVEGIYLARIGGIGNLALFLQTPTGLLLFVIVPIGLFILYDVISRSKMKKKKSSREIELEEELARLKAEKENEHIN